METEALLYMQFAEGESQKHPHLENIPVQPVHSIGVIGAGTMGSAIAISGLDAAFDVLLLEAEESALARGCKRIEEFYSDASPLSLAQTPFSHPIPHISIWTRLQMRPTGSLRTRSITAR